MSGAVELTLIVGKAAYHRQYPAGVRVHDDHGAGNLRHLAQLELALLLRRLDVDDVAGRKHLGHTLYRLTRAGGRLRPFDSLKREDADLARLDDVAALIARRLQADARRLVVDVEHHSEPPWIDIREGLHFGQRDTPVAGGIDPPDGPAPSLSFIEVDQSVDHCLAREHLQLRIERGAHGQAALVQLLLSVILKDVTAHLFGKIFGLKGAGAGRAHGDVERFFLGLVARIGGDKAVLDHAVDDVISSRNCFFAAAERIVIVRTLRQRGQISCLGDGQFMHRLVEIKERGGGDAVGTQPQINLVEIEFEDFVFRVRALDAQRQQRFLDLAGDRDFIC